MGVCQQPIADDGKIIAAMAEGEAVIRVITRRDSHLWLMPRNPTCEPINGEDANILGQVVAVLRRL